MLYTQYEYKHPYACRIDMILLFLDSINPCCKYKVLYTFNLNINIHLKIILINYFLLIIVKYLSQVRPYIW